MSTLLLVLGITLFTVTLIGVILSILLFIMEHMEAKHDDE